MNGKSETQKKERKKERHKERTVTFGRTNTSITKRERYKVKV